MSKASCDSCGAELKVEETIRIVSIAYVTENDEDNFDYEREADEAVLCKDCDYIVERKKKGQLPMLAGGGMKHKR